MRIYDGRTSFAQWDKNMRLTAETLSVGEKVHFYNGTTKNALVLLAYEYEGLIVVDVPNIFLTTPRTIKVYKCVEDGECACTAGTFTFEVEKRPKPEDYIYEQTEVYSIEVAIENALKEIDIGTGVREEISRLNAEVTGIKDYAKTQNILQTIEDTWQTRKSGGGLDIVDGWNTKLKSIAYPTDRTDGKDINIVGIRSTSKNLLNLEITNDPSFKGAEIEWTVNPIEQSLKLKGVNTRTDRDFYIQFTIYLESGTYYLRGCPWQTNQDSEEIWRALPYYIYIKRQGNGYKSISTDYGTPLSGGRFTIAENEADKYDIRCVVRRGASVDATLYPSVTQYEDTYWLPQDHYTLQPNGYFDIENSSEFSSKSYKAWRDGMEVIIGDSEVTVTQTYYNNLSIGGGEQCVAKNQGVDNAGKMLIVGEDGNIKLISSLYEVDALLGNEEGVDTETLLLREVDALLGEEK